MKQTSRIILMLIFLLMLSASLFAGVQWDDVKVPVSQLLGMVLTIFGAPLLIKLSRKIGIDISDAQANAAIDALINILVNIDFGSGQDEEASAMAKKQMAVYMADQQLSNSQKNILVKKYGSMEAAVQVAFERSSLNKKAVVK